MNRKKKKGGKGKKLHCLDNTSDSIRSAAPRGNMVLRTP